MAKKDSSLVKPGAAPPVSTGAAALPDYLRVANRAAMGTELVDQTDLVIPRVALCQAMTPQRKKSDPKYVPGLEEGMFFNNVTGKIYGPKLNFVPVFFYRTRIRFKDLDEGGGILCQAIDGKHGVGDPGGDCARCPLAAFGEDEAPECTEFKNFAAIVIPERGLPSREDGLVISFKSTGIKAAKKLNSLVRTRGLDTFASIFTLTSAEQKNDYGTFFVPTVEFAAEPTAVSARGDGLPPSLVNEQMYAVGKAIYQSMKELHLAGKLKVEMEHPDEAKGDDGGAPF